MEVQRCEFKDCIQKAEYVCINHQQKLCSKHHTLHTQFPGEHSKTRLYKTLTEEEKQAINEAISNLQTTTASQIKSELAQLQSIVQSKLEEIKVAQHSTANRITSIKNKQTQQLKALKKLKLPLATSPEQPKQPEHPQLFERVEEAEKVQKAENPINIEDKLIEDPRFHELCMNVRTCRAQSNLTELAESLMLLSPLCMKLSKVGLGIEAVKEALEISKTLDNPQLASDAASSLGFLYTRLNDSVAAIPYYEEAVKYSRQLGFSIVPGTQLIMLAEEYAKIGNITQCGRCGDQAVAELESSGETEVIVGSLIGLAKVFRLINDTFREADILRKVIYYTNKNNQRECFVEAHLGLAACYYNGGSYQDAVDTFKKGIEMQKRIGLSDNLAIAYKGLGMAYSQCANPKAAMLAFQESLRVCNMFGLQEIADDVQMRMLIEREVLHNNMF